MTCESLRHTFGAYSPNIFSEEQKLVSYKLELKAYISTF